ncbi:MAG: TetR/AcrR family transcriptional regulator [Acidimicrobiales bacterium]
MAASEAPKSSGPPGARRVPWGSISRRQVVDAATRVVRAGGYEEMSIRSLAAELGVAPMSLYRHVRDKDDLLDEVVDRLLARAWRPPSQEDWREWVAEAAEKFRRFLVTQPAALHVYLQHPVVSRSAVARMNAMMSVLRDATGGEEGARRAYAAIQTYTIGFAALEASRSGWVPIDEASDGLANLLAAHTTPRQFAEGLRYLLEGIERQAREGEDRS